MGDKERRSSSPGGPAFQSETARADIYVKVDTPEGPQATRPWLTVNTCPGEPSRARCRCLLSPAGNLLRTGTRCKSREPRTRLILL